MVVILLTYLIWWDHPNILIHLSFTLYKEGSLMEKAKVEQANICICMESSTTDYA